MKRNGVVWPLDRDRLFAADETSPRYAVIADAMAGAIAAGSLPRGTRLPTVRQLAHDLGVSVTTALAAYNRLNEGGWIRSEVGRGTFVADRTDHVDLPLPRPQIGARFVPRATAPWRRRALAASVSRLRTAHPAAADCSSGRPDPQLLPFGILKSAWNLALTQTNHAELQYSGPDPLDAFADATIPRLAADGVPARATDIVVGSSAQQFMVLALQVLEIATGSPKSVVAVEEPGYPTIFDTYERAGYDLIGVDVDECGAVPASLDAALMAGAQAVLLTPRAQPDRSVVVTSPRRCVGGCGGRSPGCPGDRR